MKVEVFLNEEKTKAIVDVKLPKLDYYDEKAKKIKIAGKEIIEILKKRGLQPETVLHSAVVRNTSEAARKGRFVVLLKGWKSGTVAEFLDLTPEESAEVEKKVSAVKKKKTTKKTPTKKLVGREFDPKTGKIKSEYE